MKSSSFNKSITRLCVRKARPIEVHILRYVEYISPIDVLVPLHLLDKKYTGRLWHLCVLLDLKFQGCTLSSALLCFCILCHSL